MQYQRLNAIAALASPSPVCSAALLAPCPAYSTPVELGFFASKEQSLIRHRAAEMSHHPQAMRFVTKPRDTKSSPGCDPSSPHGRCSPTCRAWSGPYLAPDFLARLTDYWFRAALKRSAAKAVAFSGSRCGVTATSAKFGMKCKVVGDACKAVA